MIIEQAEEADRRALWPARAQLWRGAMTSTQYVQRNTRLFSHPYSKNIVTWVGRNRSGELLTSLDTLKVFLVSREAIIQGFVIASVYTPLARRGCDYARSLIAHILSTEEIPALLYSDLRPPYYEKLGFFDSPVSESLDLVKPVPNGFSEEPLAQAHFVHTFHQQKINFTKSDRFTRIYEELDLDWNIERYRYFSELRGLRLPEDIYWLGLHGGKEHPLLVVPNFITDTMDGLVVESQCHSCIRFLMRQALTHGLSRIRYWRSEPSGELHPMARFPRNSVMAWVDKQALDYW